MREKINAELKKSMISKDLASVKTLRLIIAAIKDRDIVARSSGNNIGIDNSEILILLKKMIKQREESIKMFEKGKRLDLVKNEENEIKIISNFLPEQLSENRIIDLVKEAIEAVEATSIKDMGKVMSYLKNDYSSNMDFSFASKIIKEELLK